MREVKVLCDRCGQEITKSTDAVQIQLWNQHCSQASEDRLQMFDFCRECKKEFVKFLKQGEGE